MTNSAAATDVPVLTIDGPSGAGKGTVSRRVANALRWNLLDSGALYRLVGLAAYRRGVALDSPRDLARLVDDIEIEFSSSASGGEVVTLDGGEWLKGAGEFNDLLDLPAEVWAEFRARRGGA